MAQCLGTHVPHSIPYGALGSCIAAQLASSGDGLSFVKLEQVTSGDCHARNTAHRIASVGTHAAKPDKQFRRSLKCVQSWMTSHVSQVTPSVVSCTLPLFPVVGTHSDELHEQIRSEFKNVHDRSQYRVVLI